VLIWAADTCPIAKKIAKVSVRIASETEYHLAEECSGGMKKPVG
jgi:hypothetical protein